MKIGVISDTHDQYENILKAVEILNEHQVDLTIHCGDWVSPFTQRFYQDLKSPLKGVFGNNDGDRYYHLINAKKTGIEIEERELELSLGGRKIYVFHGDYIEATKALVACGKYDAVFHGHTHVVVNELVGQTLSLNPGTLMPFTSKGVAGASFAIYDTESNSAKIVKI